MINLYRIGGINAVSNYPHLICRDCTYSDWLEQYIQITRFRKERSLIFDSMCILLKAYDQY